MQSRSSFGEEGKSWQRPPAFPGGAPLWYYPGTVPFHFRWQERSGAFGAEWPRAAIYCNSFFLLEHSWFTKLFPFALSLSASPSSSSSSTSSLRRDIVPSNCFFRSPQFFPADSHAAAKALLSQARLKKNGFCNFHFFCLFSY